MAPRLFPLALSLAALPLLALSAAPLSAQELDAELSALDAQLPGTLVNDPRDIRWEGFGENYTKRAVTNAEIPGGGAATLYAVTAKGANPYDVSAYVPLIAPIRNGETYTAGFWARTQKADTFDGKAYVTVRFQQNASPWSGFGDKQIAISDQWEWYEFTARANLDVPRSTATMVFQLAGAAQEVLIGQTIVVSGASAIAAAPAQVAAPKPVQEAASLPPQLEGIGTLVTSLALDNWYRMGPEGTFSQRSEDIPFLDQITVANVAQKGENPWDIQLGIPITAAIEEGDRLLVAMVARTLSATREDGTGEIGLRFQQNTAPYTGFGDRVLNPGGDWQLLQFRTTASNAISANGGSLALHLGGAAQEVEIGAVYVLKLD